MKLTVIRSLLLAVVIVLLMISSFGHYALYYDLALWSAAIGREKSAADFIERVERSASRILRSEQQKLTLRARALRWLLQRRSESDIARLRDKQGTDIYFLSDPTRASQPDGLIFFYENQGKVEVASARIVLNSGNRTLEFVQDGTNPSRALILHFPPSLQAQDIALLSLDAKANSYSLELGNDWNGFSVIDSHRDRGEQNYERWNWRLKSFNPGARAVMRLNTAQGNRVLIRNIRLVWEGEAGDRGVLHLSWSADRVKTIDARVSEKRNEENDKF